MENNSVYNVMVKLIGKLSSLRETPSGKSQLAKLRNSIGRNQDGLYEVWPILFENLPEEFLGKYDLNYKEQAILTTMQLYATHQQGLPNSINTIQNINFGDSVKSLRKNSDQASIDRRFNVLLTSATYKELSHHLRQMIKLLRSKQGTQTQVNYAKLAEDLFWYQMGYENNIRIRWSRSYYRQAKKEESANNDK